MAKGKGKAKGQNVATVAPDANTTAPETTAKTEPTPAETFAAGIARRNMKGTLTTGQITFLRNKAREVALAAKAIGLKAADAFSLLTARYDMDATTLASLTVAAERVRNVEGRKTPYYAKRGYARFTWNEGAPALTWGQAEPVIRETVDTVFAAEEKTETVE